MTGLTGGLVDDAASKRMLDGLWEEPWYEQRTLADDGFAIGHRHHGPRDPGGHVTWSDGRRGGAVSGAVSDWKGLDVAEFFERVLEDPERVLANVEGSFAVAAFDSAARRFVLATDKLGSRPLYYATGDRFAFGSRLSSLVEVLDRPTLDEQAVSDLLLMGHMWGERTLLAEASALPPATFLRYDDGDVATRRYWKPTYDLDDPGDDYVFELAKRLQRAVERTASSLPPSAGLWLSGGLDSRITASELARARDGDDAFDRLVTYTYDSNPPGGVNPRLARRVSESLGVENVRVPLGPSDFVDVLEDVVLATDGMVQWNTLFNLSATFNVPNGPTPVVMEGIDGSLLGRHLNPHHFRCESAVESMYRSEAKRDAETVRELLNVDADPLATFRDEVRRSPESTIGGAVMDAHFQNYYSRMALASNAVPRTQAATRVPYVDGPFLEQAARMPVEYREQTFPFTDGRIPFGVSRPKLKVINLLDADLAAIPYEKTRLPPSYPFPAHVAGFVGTTSWKRFRSEYTYGGPSLLDDWYRDHDEFRRVLDGLVDDVCDRPFVDDGPVRDRQVEHLDGEGNHVATLAPLTTLETWLQRHLD